MYLQALKGIMKERGLKKADVARLAGVSRACVTRWFRLSAGQKGWVNVESGTFRRLQQAYRKITGLKKRLIETLLEYEQQIPLSKEARALRESVRHQTHGKK